MALSLKNIMHVHMVCNNFITKKLQTSKQEYIRNYLMKAIELPSSAANGIESSIHKQSS